MFLTKDSSEESQSLTQNVITINAYTDTSYALKNTTFLKIDQLSYSTSNFLTSYISNKDMISTTVQLSRSIPDEDIADVLDIKAYEELGLDQAKDYVISSVEVGNSGEERSYHVFVAEPEVLSEIYVPLTNQTKYIDLIVPAPLLYKTLYKKELLPADSTTHCFVYFTKHDAFVTLYANGEFIYSKSIDFSLDQIYEKYCELVGEKVDENEFFSILESEGLKTTNNDYQKNFMKIFGEIFIIINDVIIYAKRAYNLESINKVYIGSVQGSIVGLDEYSQNYLGLESSDFNFQYNIDTEQWYLDQLQYLMLLSTFDYMEDESSLVNLSIFPRPPAFLNRASGQFIVATFAAISVGLSYPLLYLVGSYTNDAKIYGLKIENNKLQVESEKYKKILGQKKKEMDVLDEKNDKLTTRYDSKTKTLTAIYDKKVKYRLKSGIFHNIADELSKFGVNVDMLYSKNDTVWISLVSESDRKLTEVIKYISDKHFDEINQIDIELIKKDPISNYYKGLLKVELR